MSTQAETIQNNLSINGKDTIGDSLVVQWLRICLPMQGHGFEPWSRRIPHVAEQLSPRATTPETHAHRSQCSTTREATAMRSPRTATKSSPCSPQLEKARMQQQRPNAAINKIFKKYTIVPWPLKILLKTNSYCQL